MEKIKSLSDNRSIFPDGISLKTTANPAELNDEETLIAKMVEKFVAEQVIPKLDTLEAHDCHTVRQLFSDAGELGLLGADVPEAYEGLALGKKTSGLIAEKMGFAGSFSVSFNIHTGVGTLPYAYFGTEKQKQIYLPKLAAGEWIGAYALTEPNAGSDALAASTTAVWDAESEKWILNGEKQWITNAHIADVYVVFAKTEKGMTAFIVERTMSGVSVGPEEEKLGINGSSTATLILEGVQVAEENRLGSIGKGHHIALNILNMARLKLAFANNGASKQALSIAVNYGKERHQFQQPIADFAMIREKLANMAIAVYGAESSVYYTAGLLDQLDGLLGEGEGAVKNLASYALDCAVNKVYASEALDFIVDEALQIHGGNGYMQEYGIECLYRNARINRIFEGTNEINRLTIAKSFLKQYERDHAVIGEEPWQPQSEGASSFVQFSMRLLQIALGALSAVDKQMLAKEQEYLRLLADIIIELYVAKAALLRQRSASRNQQVQQLITEVLCAEGYRKIETAAISIISSAISDSTGKQTLFDEIKALPVPYTDLISRKREIAAQVIKHDGYWI